MNLMTEKMDIPAFLELAETQMGLMDREYANTLRYLIHEDLYLILDLYLQLIQTKIPVEERCPVFLPK